MPVKTCKDNKNPQQSKIAGDIRIDFCERRCMGLV